MDAYPAPFLDHNVPFLVASGLSAAPLESTLQGKLKDQGFVLKSELPLPEARLAGFLNRHFAQVDKRGASWTSVSREEPYRFRIKTVGRTFILPPRRARLPDSDEPPTSPAPLHSPFPPLSPSSVLYPDGLVDVLWVRKHQELVPAIYACFYTLDDDNRLKADINEIKSALARSGYKTRTAVVLLGNTGDNSTLPPGSVQERLESIRKGTALDPKSIFYIPAKSMPSELRRTLDNVLSVLYSSAVEYYRDLGRHARKKRSRGMAPPLTVPSTTGTSRTLSLPDWNFRYDFKAAVLAEFRQEIDAANRSFEQAYEILLGQDVLDIIPNWSPRWNEARMLSDIISLRCLRIQLWMGHTSLAVRRWQSHRDRIGDVVDRRGLGTNNYGWQAWEARWATIMAQLIEKVQVSGFLPPSMTLCLQPEAAVMGERVKPWELLHHTGYWYRLAARHHATRRRLARSIPEEARSLPDSLPPSRVGSKTYAWDNYMCPAPYREYPLVGQGVNHAQLIIDCLVAAQAHFRVRDQRRLVAEISLECAREMASLAAWKDVMVTLEPIWSDAFFRAEGWILASHELCWLLRQAAAETGNAGLVVIVDWELLHRKFPRRPHWHYDLERSLDGVAVDARPAVSISDEVTSPFVTASFVFRTQQCRAGERCTAQLALHSDALPGSAAVTFSALRVEFSGSLKPILIEHAAPEGGGVEATGPEGSIDVIALEEESSDDPQHELPSRHRGLADLTLKPGQRRVLEMTIPLREAGEERASSVTLMYRNDTFDLDQTLRFRDTDVAVGWYTTGSAVSRHKRFDASAIQVQLRPPKLQMEVAGRMQQYYTNEMVDLQVHVRNGDEPADVTLDVVVSGDHVVAFQAVMDDGTERSTDVSGSEESRVSGIPLGIIDNGSSRHLVVRVHPVDAPTTCEVQLQALYHLESDTATPITQTAAVTLNMVTPFEANYDFLPRLHAAPWPSVFDADHLVDRTAAPQSQGLVQKWSLVCQYASFALEDLLVMDVDVVLASPPSNAQCRVDRRPQVPEEGLLAAPKTMHEADFELVVQKHSLDDRHAATIDLGLVLKWRRKDAATDSPINTTTLPAGQFQVLGSEPRVLASVLYESRDARPSQMCLDVTIENPSNHLLTFGVTMEPSDSFAFSGAKQTTLHLLPLSRRTVRFRLVPLVRGTYIRPDLVIRDKYFQKVLRIIAIEGLKTDKDGLMVWVPKDGPAVAEG